MNFGVSGESIGLIGVVILFGAMMLVFTVVVTAIVRFIRGRDDEPDGSHLDRRAPEDDYIL